MRRCIGLAGRSQNLDLQEPKLEIVGIDYVVFHAFLPGVSHPAYQPRLSEYGMEYTTAHDIKATRDPDCDEMLTHLGPQGTANFKYSEDAPKLDFTHQRFRLPCYETTAEDYDAPLK